jgi:hypothetical protein
MTEPCRCRPRIKTSCDVSSLRNPHLLQRRPVVGCALCSEQVQAIRLLKFVIHLQPAVIGSIGISPASLIAVNAPPCSLMWGILKFRPDVASTFLPHVCDPANIFARCCLALMMGTESPALSHEFLKLPCFLSVISYLVDLGNASVKFLAVMLMMMPYYSLFSGYRCYVYCQQDQYGA